MVTILSPTQEEILKKERRLLTEVETSLTVWNVDDTEVRRLAESVRQLDELFLLVVVGEFNAGKSAFINALLGRQVLAEGVTPTTSRIHLLSFGDEAKTRSMDTRIETTTAEIELLRHLNIVDTPGTNALDRTHEAITSEFVPRSDLVLFVTSADRPFSESERNFLEKIKNWGKKIFVIINKIDILKHPDQVDEVLKYVGDNARALLGVEPTVLQLSAVQAMQARSTGDQELLASSGMVDTEKALLEILRSNDRVALKLKNPLGVANNLLSGLSQHINAEFEHLGEDLKTLDDIDGQLKAWTDDINREFKLRLTDIENYLHKMERRGIAFFDDRLRLGKITKLFNAEAVKRDFEHEVVADMPQQIETKVEAIIDWMVQSSLNQWTDIIDHVNKRKLRHEERIVGEKSARFSIDRSELLETIGRASHEQLDTYDRKHEARKLADDVQRAVAGTAIVEVGAIGLGATIAVLASGTAADATGLIAASLVAALGMFILPHKRRLAKSELTATIADLNERLMTAITEQFDSATRNSESRVRETIAPYTRFVTAERDRITERRDQIESLKNRIEDVQSQIENELGRDSEATRARTRGPS